LKTIWRYKDYLPPVANNFQLSIGEGQTPLVRSRSIGPSLGLSNLYFKLENLNPTGSYKDRFAATFVSTLLQQNASYCIATSSGNTGAALAAYCAAAKINCYLFIVDGAPLPKIRQMQLYGGKTMMMEGFGIDAAITNRVFSHLEQLAKTKNISLPISAYRYCSEGMQGVQTIAYEVLDELEGNADHIFSPAGGGGLTLAISKGVIGYKAAACKVHCVQPRGNDTIASALKTGALQAAEIPRSTTLVSGLQVPGILDGTETLHHCRQTGGTGFIVDDKTIFETQKLLAQKEGIFCEPAGAVSVSCIAQATDAGYIGKDENIVCLITGSGFKDMSMVEQQFHLPPTEKKYDSNHLLELLATIEKHESF